MKKKEILEESTEQQETIEERRGLKEIEKDLDDTRYAIKKEIQSYEQEEKKIHQFEKTELGKQAEKAKLILKHLKKMRKLHENKRNCIKSF